MTLFFATTVLAAPLHLPMPAATLCGNAPAEAAVGAGSDIDYEEWSAMLECDTEAGCLSAIRKLQDPTMAVREQRRSEVESWSDAESGLRYVDSPVSVAVTMNCLGTGANARWVCDEASCSLTTERAAPGLKWVSEPWGTVPGTPTAKVAELVARPEVELSGMAKVELADMTAGAASRMVTVLDHCEQGGCGEGWRTIRAYAETLATVERPEYVGFTRGMWSDRGFVATYAPAGPAQPAGLTAELDCYAISGECDMHEETCNLMIARDNLPIATFIGDEDKVTWDDAQFGITQLPNNAFGYVRTEGHSAR